MAVKLIIDSASDVLPQEAEALGVVHVPLQVMFGDETFYDSVDLSHEEFYKKLAVSKNLPTTSQVTPAAFAEQYEKVTAAGDEAVVITISSVLSGTYQSAIIAAEDYEGKVFVVDSLSAAIGERVLLMRALELVERGLSGKEIAEKLDEEKKSIRLMAMVDTLEYLKKGGRISAATAVAGTLLSIKPAIELKAGAVAMAGTARGAKKANALFKQLIDSNGGINWNKPVAFVYSGLNDDLLRGFLEEYPQLTEGQPVIPVYSLGCAIGTHVGPGAYGVAFFEE